MPGEWNMEALFPGQQGAVTRESWGSGNVGTAWRLQRGERQLFLKAVQQESLPILYEHQIRREAFAVPLCRQMGIPTPELVDFSEEGQYVVRQFMPDALLGQIWEDLTGEEKLNFKRQVLTLVNTMCCIEGDHFGAFYEGGALIGSDSWQEVYENVAKVSLSDCVHFGALTEAEAAAVLERVKENAKALPPQEKSVLCHLDLHYNNLFADRETGKITGLFDFGNAMFAPPFMSYFRLRQGLLYGKEEFYDEHILCPIPISEEEETCAAILSTLDDLTFLSFKGRDFRKEKEFLTNCYQSDSCIAP